MEPVGQVYKNEWSMFGECPEGAVWENTARLEVPGVYLATLLSKSVPGGVGYI